MSSPSTSTPRKENKSPPEANSPSPSTVNKGSNVANQIKRLSLSTSLSPSPQPNPAARAIAQRSVSTSSPNAARSPRSAIHRSPSSMSMDARSSTPTLLRKASMNSIHGVSVVTPPRSSPSRSASMSQAANGRRMSRSPLSNKDEAPPAPRHTAASIAKKHFRSELDIHQDVEDERTAETIVILHDSCYGHRFSRPRTSRAALSTIVERPERIQASVLGVSVAYVRLGDRHSEGQYPLHPSRDATNIPTIPFSIRKTTRKLALTSPAVTNVHGTKWMGELKIMCDSAEAKLAMNGKELARPDLPRSPDEEAPAKFHEGDLYLCSESLDAMEGALGAVCEGVDAVFEGSANGKGPHRTFIAIRPPGHHCSASYPSGFCWLNNVHVGIAHAALTHGLTHAAIIDFDLHHGDGSQAIAWGHNSRARNLPKNAAPWKKTSIGYFSLHDINSYPCEMGDEEKVKNASLCIENAHGQNVWNVHLQPWKSEAEFWELYETKYSVLLEKTRNYLRTQTERLRASPNLPKPKSAIFLSAGFDASEWESSGMQRHKVNVPTEFYARLTRDVVELAAEEGSAAEGRVISVLEGGYSDRALCTGVLSHISGLAGGKTVAVKKEEEHNGLGYEMGQKIGLFDSPQRSPTNLVSAGIPSYDPMWWSLPKLEQLDAVMSNTQTVYEPRPTRETTPPTYSSPTQSSMAKVVSSPRMNRSLSNMSAMSSSSPRPASVVRPPSPPPPEVHWTVAAHELSKLLIPSERQINSCRPEDLSAEATRARRDRQSILTPPVAEVSSAPSTASTRMALRERKPAKPVFDAMEDESRKAKAPRRKTVAGAAVLAAEKTVSRSSTPKPDLPNNTQSIQQPNRRLSTASTTASVFSEAPSSRPSGSSRIPSGTATLPYRPGSSQSIRPDSSMSSRGPSLAVKKTRAPAASRREGPKPVRVRQESSLDGTSGSSSAQVPLPESSSQSSHASDMDSLTSGMKRIKINLTTKAQREAKDGSKASIKAPKPPRSTKPKQSESSEILPPEPLPSQVLSSIPSYVQEASETPLPPSSPIVPAPMTPNVSTTEPESPGNVFIPYQPDGPPASTTAPTPESLRWLPPNTATPGATPGATPIKKNELPVFTATSAIPFGVNPNHALAGAENGASATGPSPHGLELEVPETPPQD
ncbi:arginase [Coleophoma cylindrospora]|uniref:Arginase n=1 Tax=Coleophoma cylindrospora TaxID=1849047 RepID=A0A3D8R5Y1_9HELO|nr:arginase [Coleophoma cylindrospora]